MKKIINKLICNIVLCIFLIYSDVVLSGSDDNKEQFINNMSAYSVKTLCAEDELPANTKFSHDECLELLSKRVEECNKLIEPLVPELSLNKEEIRIRSYNLGMLYTMCLKLYIYEAR